MALNFETKRDLPDLRSRTKKRLTGETKPKDIFATDPTKPLGRDPRSGIEGRLGQLTQDLDFDVEGERASRTGEIERRSEESRQRVARIFSLDPSGIKQGRAVRAFSEIEGGRNRELAELETDLSKRSSVERRANIQTIRGVQESREGAAISQVAQQQEGARDLSAFVGQQEAAATGERALTETERSNIAREGISGRALTETERAALISENLQGIALTEQNRAALVAEGLSEQQINEVIRKNEAQEGLQGRALTETERAALISESLQGRALTETERAALIAENLQGRALNETERAAMVAEGLSERQINEIIRKNEAQEGLQGRALTETERAALISETLQGRVQTETERASLITENLQGRALDETERAAMAAEGLSEQQIDEVIRKNEAQETLQGRALDETERAALIAETLQERVQTEAEQQFDRALYQRAVEFSQRHDLSVDEFNEKVRQFDEGIDLEDDRLEEDIRQYNLDLDQQKVEFVRRAGLEEAGLTGRVAGEELTSLEMKRRLGIDPGQAFWDTVREARAAGFTYDEETRTFRSEGQETLAAREQRQQQALKEAQTFTSQRPVTFTVRDFTTATNVTQPERGDPEYRPEFDLNNDGKIDLADRGLLSEARQSGRAEMLSGSENDPDGVVQFTPLGKQTVFTRQLDLEQQRIDLAARTQRQQQALEEGRAVGEVSGKKTIEQQRIDIATDEQTLREGIATGIVDGEATVEQQRQTVQAEIQRGTLDLQKKQQDFDERATEAEITGYYRRFGLEGTNAFIGALGTSRGEEGYDPRFDFNVDGQIDIEDNRAFADIMLGEQAQTLRGRQVTSEIAQRTFTQTMDKAGLTGTLEGEETVQEAQRTFDNRLKEAQIFTSMPPVTFTVRDFAMATQRTQPVKGDPEYRPEFDLNSDGRIDFEDARLMGEATQSGRAEKLSGTGENPDDVILFTPPGKQTVIAKKLQIEERKLTQASLEFETEFDSRQREFDSNFTGYLFDENGNITQREVTENTPYGPITVIQDVPALEREKLEQQKIEWDENMEHTVSSFVRKMELDEKTMSSQKWVGIANAVSTFFQKDDDDKETSLGEDIITTGKTIWKVAKKLKFW